MKNLNLSKLLVLGTLLAMVGSAATANAQTVRHDHMDAAAARRDISRLKADRERARHYHNWNKVDQDNRLIESDQHWIRKDKAKINRAKGW